VPSDSRRVRWTINNARQLTLKIDNRHIQLMDHRMNLKSKPQPKDNRYCANGMLLEWLNAWEKSAIYSKILHFFTKITEENILTQNFH